MIIEYSLEQLELLGKNWTDQFAKDREWRNHFLSDPVDALDIFFKHIPGERMLDVGCGWGRYVSLFTQQGLDYIGLDLSSEMLKVAQADNPGLSFIEASLRKIPFPDGYFDGLWSCCTLQAIPKAHIVSVLEEHRRVLAPSGILMITLPSPGFSNEEVYRNDDGEPSIFQAHYVHNEFVQYVDQTEFTLIESENWSFSQGSMSALLRK